MTSIAVYQVLNIILYCSICLLLGPDPLPYWMGSFHETLLQLYQSGTAATETAFPEKVFGSAKCVICLPIAIDVSRAIAEELAVRIPAHFHKCAWRPAFLSSEVAKEPGASDASKICPRLRTRNSC